MKQELKIKCECGKEIKGFSEGHLKGNLAIHKLSKEHKLMINLLKRAGENKPVYVANLNINMIAKLLANNPIIIEDIKEIGRISA
jgi:hypothetical protein